MTWRGIWRSNVSLEVLLEAITRDLNVLFGVEVLLLEVLFSEPNAFLGMLVNDLSIVLCL